MQSEKSILFSEGEVADLRNPIHESLVYFLGECTLPEGRCWSVGIGIGHVDRIIEGMFWMCFAFFNRLLIGGGFGSEFIFCVLFVYLSGTKNKKL